MDMFFARTAWTVIRVAEGGIGQEGQARRGPVDSIDGRRAWAQARVCP